MSKEMLVIALGLVIALMTQLGLPIAWKLPLLFLLGLGVAFVGFLLRGEVLGRGTRGYHGTSFVESAPRVDEKRDGINSLN